MQEQLREAGMILEYLPQYPPDLNPIDINGHKLKLSLELLARS